MANANNTNPLDVFEQEVDEDEEPEIDFRDPPYPGDLQLRTVPQHPDLLRIVRKEWRLIRSYELRISAYIKQYNLRYDEPFPVRLKQFVQGIYDAARRPFFIIAMGGYYLQISEMEASLFFAEENTQIFANPAVIKKQADIDRFLEDWPSNAQIVRDFKNYFDTKVKVLGIANFLFCVGSLGGHTLEP